MALLLFLWAAPAAAQEQYVSHSYSVPKSISAKRLTAVEKNLDKLNRIVSFNLQEVTLREALEAIVAAGNLNLIYADWEVLERERIDLHLEGMTVLEALHEAIRDTRLGLKITMSGQIIVTPVREAPQVRLQEPTAPEPPVIVHAVSGQVTSVEDGLPLPGVNVVVKGTMVGTATDTEGRYTLDAPNPTDTLVFSYIGFTTLEVPIDGRSVVDVRMAPDVYQAGELVVVGYGQQRRETLTGSVAEVSGEDLRNRPITNATQALQGVQGLYVNQASGQPGADFADIRIRGVGTIGGAAKLEPLVLVDGVEYPLSALNAQDIESITVLKDAASTAIYGSRAANGVILITTKMARQDELSVTYSGYLGVQRPTYLPDPVDDSVVFMEMYNRAMINQGAQPLYSDELINEFRTNPTSLQYPNTNWMEVMFDDAPIQEHNLQFSGSSGNTRYNMSLGYLNQEGILMSTDAQRYSLSLRVNSDIGPRLNVEGTVRVNRWDALHPSQGTSTAMNRLMRMVPMQPLGQMEDGSWPDSWVITPGQNSFENPLTRAREAYRNLLSDRVLASATATYTLAKGLNYRVRGSVNTASDNMEDWKPAIMMVNVSTGEPTRNWGSAYSTKIHRQDRNQTLILTNTLEYDTNLSDNHFLTALVGSEVERFDTEYMQASVQDFPSRDLQELNLGIANKDVAGTSNTDALASFFGRVSYSFRDKYLLEVSSRYDGSSRFAAGNRWGFFPSVSAGWRIAEEGFMQGLDWLDELRIKGSWGQIGNQEIGRFQFINAVSLGYGYPFGGVYTGGVAVTQSRDPSLRWETTTMSNLGLDWAIFGHVLSGNVEFFHKRTDGILRTVQLPSQVGNLAGPVKNVAVVDNVGIEVGIIHRNRINNDFSYEIGGHLTHIKNEVVDMQGEEIIGSSNITRAGLPINAWWVYKTDGLFQSQEEVDSYPTISSRVGPGDIKYVDLNGDNVINGDDRYFAGSPFPDLTYGFNIGMRYKRLSLETVWNGVLGIKTYADFNMASPFYNGAGLQKEWVTDSWTPDNPNARLPRITARNQYSENFQYSDFWLEDASYLRLKNIQLSYQIIGGPLSRAGVRMMELFVNGQNLLTFSKVQDWDPERVITQTNLSQYPSVKAVSLGLNLTF